MQESLKEFYVGCKNEEKTYKGYVLTGIDGSDFEISNTKSSREKYIIPIKPCRKNQRNNNPKK